MLVCCRRRLHTVLLPTVVAVLLLLTAVGRRRVVGLVVGALRCGALVVVVHLVTALVVALVVPGAGVVGASLLVVTKLATVGRHPAGAVERLATALPAATSDAAVRMAVST